MKKQTKQKEKKKRRNKGGTRVGRNKIRGKEKEIEKVVR